MMRALDRRLATAPNNNILSYRECESVYRHAHFRTSHIRQLNLFLNEGLIYGLAGTNRWFDIFSRYQGHPNVFHSLLYRTHKEMRENGWAKFHAPDYIRARESFSTETQLADTYEVSDYGKKKRIALLGDLKITAAVNPILDLPCLLDSSFAQFDVCYYCQSPLRRLSDVSLPYKYVEIGSDLAHGNAAARTVFECENCGWWAIETEGHDAVEYGGDGDGTDNDCVYSLVCGVLKRFSVNDRDVPIDELRKWLSNHPDDITSVDPFVFERLVADCLRHYYTNSEIRLVGGRRDMGIDIFAIAENGEPTIIQVKRRTRRSATESVNTVRELNGVLFREGIPNGMVITSACQFSRDAWQEVERAAQTNTAMNSRYRVELKNAEFLLEILELANKGGNYCCARDYLDRYIPPQFETVFAQKALRFDGYATDFSYYTRGWRSIGDLRRACTPKV